MRHQGAVGRARTAATERRLLQVDFLFGANHYAFSQAAGIHPTRGAAVPRTIEVLTGVGRRAPP